MCFLEHAFFFATDRPFILGGGSCDVLGEESGLFGRGVPKRSYPLTAAITHNTVLYSRHLFLVAGWYLKTGLFCIARLYDAYGTKIPALESKARLCTCAYTSRESQRTAVYAVGHVPPREISEA